EPRRNLPRAIVIGVLIVIGAYLLTNWAYLRLLGVEGVATSKALAAEAVSRVVPGAAKRRIAGAGGRSRPGALAARLLVGVRMGVPLCPLVPLFFVLGELGVVVGAYLDSKVRVAAVIGVCWILGAAILYFVAFSKKRVSRG